jgi:hypothetical protein
MQGRLGEWPGTVDLLRQLRGAIDEVAPRLRAKAAESGRPSAA